MATEKDKMLLGEWYNAANPELVIERMRCRSLVKQFNDTSPYETDTRLTLLKSLLPNQGNGSWIEPPFYCDYGTNITIGDRVFFNFNCTVLDVMQVTIGDDVLFGPSVQIYTAMHPMDWQERASGLEFAKPITIGSNVWIGGSVIICPGVNIAAKSVIGAGSVVTRDIPEGVLAAGNPCKPIRQLNI